MLAVHIGLELVFIGSSQFYFMEVGMKVKAYIHSLKDHEHNRHVLGEAEIIECIGDNRYLAEVNGIRCSAIFNFFAGAYYVDDVYGVLNQSNIAQNSQ